MWTTGTDLNYMYMSLNVRVFVILLLWSLGKVGELWITWKPLDPWNYNGPGIGYEVRWRDLGDFDEDWDGVSSRSIHKQTILSGTP